MLPRVFEHADPMVEILKGCPKNSPHNPFPTKNQTGGADSVCCHQLSLWRIQVPKCFALRIGLLPRFQSVLGGSGDLVSKVISPLIGVISNYKYSYLIYNPSY